MDLHGCNPKTFTRRSIARYFREMCDLIDMQRDEMHFWDDYGVPKAERVTEPHLVGTSAIQFIMTSNITIHTLPLLKYVAINVFSCKMFSWRVVEAFAQTFFQAQHIDSHTFPRSYIETL